MRTNKKVVLAGLMLVILNLGSAAWASSEECSSPNGDIRYSSWAKEGGAAPGPGLTLCRQAWFYKGKLVREEILRYLEPSQVTGSAEGQFFSSTVVAVSKFRNRFVVSSTYAVQVNLKGVEGLEEGKSISEFVLCKTQRSAIPIP